MLRHRWMRFSLRPLLIALVLVVPFTALQVRRARQRNTAIANLTEAGAMVAFDWAFDSNGNYVATAKPSGPNSIRNLLGDGYLYDVVLIQGQGQKLNDSTLAHSACLPELQQLSLRDSQITDRGLEALRGMTGLRSLTLNGAPAITGDGFANLSGMTSLAELRLGNTGLTDAGLRHIASLTSLRELYVPDTAITDAGLAHLRLLPRLSVLLLDGKAITDAGLRQCSRLVHIERLGILHASISDAGLASLVSLRHLVALDLQGSPVTDAGLAPIGQLTNLEYLGLSQTRITDAGLAHVRGLVNLRHLVLSQTSVTDAGLVHLRKLSKLSQLELDGTQVTDNSPARRLANRQGTLVGVGDSAPDIVLTRLDGTAVRLSELRGKVVCLNFFATWCAPCRRELPALQTMWDQFRDNKDFTMLIVSRKESQGTVTSFKSEQHFTFPLARDPDCSAFNQFATQGIPRTYLISHDGTIVYQSVGCYAAWHEQEIARLRHLVRQQLNANAPRGKRREETSH